MVRWTRLATVILLALVACTPFEAAPDGTDPSNAGDPDAAARDGAFPDAEGGDAGSTDATTPVDVCAGSFLYDDFERSELADGPVDWTKMTSGEALIAIETRPDRDGGLVAWTDAVGSNARITAERPFPIGGARSMTVKLTYEVAENGCSGKGYTDLLQVVVQGIGYMNLNFGTDCELHLSFGCEGATPSACNDWVPLLQGGSTTGRLHELEFGARVTGNGAEGFYELDGVGGGGGSPSRPHRRARRRCSSRSGSSTPTAAKAP